MSSAISGPQASLEPEAPAPTPAPVLPHPAPIRVALQRTGSGDFSARCYDDDGADLAYVTVRQSSRVDVAVWTMQEQDARYKAWEYFRAVEAEIAQRWGAL